MTDNTQPEAPAAPRPIKRFYRGTDCMAENQAGDWVRYEDHVTVAAELLRQRAYVDADRAARTPPAQAVETPGGDTYAEYKAWADAASQCDKEPHTELRKSWAPGQRWQTRIPAFTEWFELTAPPAWFWYAEYRRHPEDVSTTSQADSGAVPVDVPVNRIPLLDERDQECALVRTARGWEFHRNGDLIRELNIYERLFVDSALAAARYPHHYDKDRRGSHPSGSSVSFTFNTV